MECPRPRPRKRLHRQDAKVAKGNRAGLKPPAPSFAFDKA